MVRKNSNPEHRELDVTHPKTQTQADLIYEALCLGFGWSVQIKAANLN